jgi:hypothetical protein
MGCSPSVNCTYSEMLTFNCQSCFVQLYLKWTTAHSSDTQFLAKPFVMVQQLLKLYMEKYAKHRLPNTRFVPLIIASGMLVLFTLPQYTEEGGEVRHLMWKSAYQDMQRRIPTPTFIENKQPNRWCTWLLHVQLLYRYHLPFATGAWFLPLPRIASGSFDTTVEIPYLAAACSSWTKQASQGMAY